MSQKNDKKIRKELRNIARTDASYKYEKNMKYAKGAIRFWQIVSFILFLISIIIGGLYYVR